MIDQLLDRNPLFAIRPSFPRSAPRLPRRLKLAEVVTPRLLPSLRMKSLRRYRVMDRLGLEQIPFDTLPRPRPVRRRIPRDLRIGGDAIAVSLGSIIPLRLCCRLLHMRDDRPLPPSPPPFLALLPLQT